MDHILADPAGLSERAQSFLRRHATRSPFDATVGPSDEELRQQLRACFGITDDAVLRRLREAQARYGGLCYRSPLFGTGIEFHPWPGYEAEDGEPIAWFIELAVASPLAVWMLADGTIACCQPGPPAPGGTIVPVFPTGDALIEADALDQECTTWTRVDGPGPLGADAVRAAAERTRLSLLEAASGFTQWWWEGDGFRLNVSRTFAEIAERPQEGTWRIWADGAAAERAALDFLGQVRETS